MTEKKQTFATRAVHSGQRPDPETGAHVTPIYQTSTFAYGSFARGERLFAGDETGYVYSRVANPTTRSFEQKLADLEGAEDAVAFASGMAAIAGLCLTVLQAGDEIIYLGPLYGGTEGLFYEVLTKFGVSISPSDTDMLADKIRSTTRMIYVETPTNPTLRIHDLSKIANLAKQHGILAVADNTFSTPYLTRPLELGFDVVLHSATKYLGGHGDAIGGVLATRADLAAQIRAEGLRHVGGSLGPQESYLFLRGMKTLALRIEAQCHSAMLLAQKLQHYPVVKRVFYPGLAEHPGHEIALRQMKHFGGMLSLELRGGRAAAEAFLDALRLFTQAVSLGDVESLATHPASTTHQLLPETLLNYHGISQGLVRLSVGIEDPRDLLADIEQALGQVGLEVSAWE